MNIGQSMRIAEVLFAHPAKYDSVADPGWYCDGAGCEGYRPNNTLYAHARHQADALASVVDAMLSDAFEQGQERPAPNPYKQ